MATTSNMFLYSLTIQPPTAITQALLGQFSGTREQQIIIASGSRLSLLQPDPRQGKVNMLLSHDVFGIIRAIASFRLAGSHKGEYARPDHPHPPFLGQLVILDPHRSFGGMILVLETRGGLRTTYGPPLCAPNCAKTRLHL